MRVANGYSGERRNFARSSALGSGTQVARLTGGKTTSSVASVRAGRNSSTLERDPWTSSSSYLSRIRQRIRNAVVASARVGAEAALNEIHRLGSDEEKFGGDLNECAFFAFLLRHCDMRVWHGPEGEI